MKQDCEVLPKVAELMLLLSLGCSPTPTPSPPFPGPCNLFLPLTASTHTLLIPASTPLLLLFPSPEYPSLLCANPTREGSPAIPAKAKPRPACSQPTLECQERPAKVS